MQLPIWRNSLGLNGATIKGEYRYDLWRVFQMDDDPLRTVTFVMLNPSTADAEDDDATIRRCRAFAKLWGFNRLVVVNLFAYQSTDPKVLRTIEDPIGPENDAFIERAVLSSEMVIAAWGNNAVWSGRYSMRNKEVIDIIVRHRDIYCLGTTLQHQPCHPVRLRGDLEPQMFWKAAAGVPSEIGNDVTKTLENP